MNKHTPRFTSLYTKKLTRARRKERKAIRRNESRYEPPQKIPAIATMPLWLINTMTAIERLRDTILPPALTAHQKRSGRGG